MKNYVITFLNLFFFIFIFGCVSSNSEIKSLSSATKTLTCEFISYGSEECKIRRKSDREICEDVKCIKKGVCIGNLLSYQDEITLRNINCNIEKKYKKTQSNFYSKQKNNLYNKNQTHNKSSKKTYCKGLIKTLWTNCFAKYQYKNGDKYIGDWMEGKMHGFGSLNFKNGDKYRGFYKNNKRDGKGVYNWSNGDSYVGSWKEGKESGLGTYTWSNGNKYVGNHKNGKEDGYGEYIYKNGKKKKGYWQEGKFISNLSSQVQNKNNHSLRAFGSVLYSDFKLCSKKQIKLKHNCFGKKIFKNGIFTGEFKNNKLNGLGKFETYKKDVYLGEFKNNKYSGKGKYFYNSGHRFNGNYLKGKREGYGHIKYKDGSEYFGNYVNGEKSGYGKYYFSNGNSYKGYFKNGKYNGKGAFYFADNSKYIGMFKDNKYHGLGTMTLKNGKSFSGKWAKNKFLGYTEQKTFKKNQPEISVSELEKERKKIIFLENELERLKKEKKQRDRELELDRTKPSILINFKKVTGKQGILKGKIMDSSGVAELSINNKKIDFNENGEFIFSTFVPFDGVDIKIEAVDMAGISNSKIVNFKRKIKTTTNQFSFERLNPISKMVKKNPNAVAIIIGIQNYESITIPAIYADKDALMFKDYATEILGIEEKNIKYFINEKAEYAEILLSVKSWLRRVSKPNETELYLFFAGHGLASDNGKNLYLLPYDGRKRLLEKTAILKEELFEDILLSKPRFVNVFLDTCYSGTTRSSESLINSRPVSIVPKVLDFPDNFTIFVASQGDETSKPLEEAQHGIFSYFLMKGMEGYADKNDDKKITAGELHQYVKNNVIQHSSGSQNPEFFGDTRKVLINFN